MSKLEKIDEEPAPTLESLIRRHRALIEELTREGGADPDALKLADQLLRTVTEYARNQAQAAHKKTELEQAERKLKIAEREAAATKAAQAPPAKQMTAEEKMAEYRRIFGMGS
jgi:hypothetical protein